LVGKREGGRELISGCAVVALLALLLAPAAGAHSLTVVSPTEVSLSPSGKNKIASAKVTVKNDGGASAVTFKVVPADKVIVRKQSAKTIDGFDVEQVTVTLQPKDPTKKFTGTLVVSGDTGVAPGTVSLKFAPKPKAPDWLYFVIFAPLVGAVLWVCARWLVLWRQKYKLGKRLGPANWDFSKSWGSNVTVVGALLGTILAAGVLPEETTTASKATYSGLNLFFGILVLVAPLIYVATQRAKDVHRSTTVKEAQYQGFVWSFLIASTLTLWAAVGELVTVGLLLQEIRTTDSLPEAVIWVMWVIIGLAVLLLALYAWRSIGAVVKVQTDTETLRRRKREELMTLRTFVGGDAELPAAVPAETEIEPELPAVAPL
jgi:hypothetical protein